MLRLLAVGSAAIGFFWVGSALAEGVYMGKAVTGESVYYNGASAQCGELPASNSCWRNNPSIDYGIGGDRVFAVGDCQRGVFKEVWVNGKIVQRDMVPRSRAIQKVLVSACRSVQQ